MMSAQQASNPQLDWALYYASLGWSVVPSHRVVRLEGGQTACTCEKGTACISKGKHPAVGWVQFQETRADENCLRSWFTGKYKGFGVGIITGRVSGIFVIDVDEAPGKDGPETLRNLQIIHDDLPITVTAKTGGGGRHFLFKHPGGDAWITTARNVLGPGVDVRGDGGFIVAAPSLHESNRLYLWDENAHPRTTEISDSPAWLIEIATGAPPIPGQTAPSTGHGEIIRDAWGKIIDGRERYMIGVVCGVIATKLRETGTLPNADDVFSDAWPTYERAAKARGASLEADGRGETLMRDRIKHFLRRAATGKWKVSAEPRPFSPGAAEQAERIDPETGEILPPDFPATPLSALNLNVGPRRWLYGRELVRGYVSVLGSPGGVGKTAYTLAVGFSVALGRSLLAPAGAAVGAQPPASMKVHKTGPVWFYNLEDPNEEMERRVKAVLIHHKIDPGPLGDQVFVDSGRDRPLIIAARSKQGDLIATPIVPALVSELKRRGIRLLVVDPFVQSHGAEENRNDEMNLVMALWGSVAHQADCSVWLVHHFRKGGQSGDGEAFRGAGAIQGAARVMSTLGAMTRDEASKLGVDEEQRRQYIRLDNAKSNMAPPPNHAQWFKLVGISLDNADDEYPEGDWVQSVELWCPPSPWDGMPWSIITDILDKITKGPEPDERYTLAKQAKERWAGRVIVETAGRTEGQASSILKAWVENGVLEEGEYMSASKKKQVACVSVNQAKVSEMRRAEMGGE